eukprot:922713_1
MQKETYNTVEKETINDVVGNIVINPAEGRKYNAESGTDLNTATRKKEKEKKKKRKRKYHESERNDVSLGDAKPLRKKRKIDDDHKHQPSNIIEDGIALTREQILNSIEFLQLPLLSQFNNHLQHAFFTRNGGVSTDEGVQSLNVLFSKEDHKNVFENRL